MRLYFDLLRLFAQQVKENRYIMGSKVPDHVDIIAKESQVHAFSFDAVDFPEFTALYELAQFIYSGAVFKGMPHHQDELLFPGNGHKFFGLCHIGGERLFNQDMFAVQQGLFGQPVVCPYGSGNHNAIDIRTKDILCLCRQAYR